MSDASDKHQYRLLLSQVMAQLDSLIYEVEDFALGARTRANNFHELKFDAIPILRKLKDARKYTKQSQQHYEKD
jgi:hypothetical protein